MNRVNTNTPVGFVGLVRWEVASFGYCWPMVIAEIEAGMLASRWVERKLQHPVVKAFNNIYAQHLMKLGLPAGTSEDGQLNKGGSR
jgi:hypothetical protein